jgi:hypothetical protein
LAPDQRVAVPELDANGGDFVEAVGGCAHRATMADSSFQFQGGGSDCRL